MNGKDRFPGCGAGRAPTPASALTSAGVMDPCVVDHVTVRTIDWSW